MIIGKIVGKVTTTRCEAILSHPAKKFDYVQIHHRSYGYVLCQIVEIIRENENTKAIIIVLGYADATEGTTKMIREPFDPGSEVLAAQDEMIAQVIHLKTSNKGAYIGKLEGRDIPIYLDLQKLLTKHIAVLAKSGAGKSYCVGVLLEEIMEKGVPLLVIDPHGEYHTLRYKSEEQGERLKRFNTEAKSYLRKIKMYGDTSHNPECTPLLLSDSIHALQLMQLLPKLSPTQEAVMYSAMKNSASEGATLDGIMYALEQEESPAKFSLLQQLQYLSSLKLFSKVPVALNELVQTNRCSIVNLRGISPDVQQIIVYKLLSDIFEARKKGNIPPFFCVIEEAHNYCPEKNFGNAKSTGIIRTIASEGRKFGMGLGIISQRPARVDKSVLSQVTTQIILKVTNPNDIKAISNSVEGLTSESCDELQNLSIGTALVTGVVDMPLLVNIRPRRTKHGGEAVDILEQTRGAELFNEIKEFSEQHIIPLIEPAISMHDVQLMHPQNNISAIQVPAVLVRCHDSGEFTVLVELVEGNIVTDITTMATKKLPDIEKLTPHQLKVLEKAFFIRTFTFEEFCTKSGFGIDVKDALDILISQGYLHKKKEIYNINENIILTKLSKYHCAHVPVYKATPAQRKAKKEFSVDKIKQKLSRFTSVNSVQDCWILKYEVL